MRSGGMDRRPQCGGAFRRGPMETVPGARARPRPPLVPPMKRSLVPVAAAAAAVTLSASEPVFWQVSTQAEFLRGEVDALSVDGDGRLRLGPAADVVLETPEPALWSLARAADGAVWAGSGADGRVYRLGPGGAGAVVFDADELDVHALAADREGGVFAGASPGGRVYHVTAGGEARVVADLDETYVWALALAADGALHVATGNPARVYRVQAGGARELVYESDAAHVLALAAAADGALLAGTGSPGQVLRIDASGRAFVLLDTPYEEIRALRPQPDGSLLAVAVNGRPAPAAPAAAPPAAASAPAPTPTVSVTTSVTAVVVGAAAAAEPRTPTAAAADAGGKGAVYHVTADGLWDRWWRSSLDTPFDAAFDDRGTLVVGTGPDGKLYRVSRDPARTVLAGRAPARQVTRLLPAADGSTWYATANPGKVLRMENRLAPRGTYESEVRDAAAAARWGVIRWRGTTPAGGRIELASRSGNTAIPNDTWSPWSAAYTDAAGSPIASPNARYLQWRATLHGGDGGASPVLTSVTAAYLPRNLRPEVTQLTVHPPGAAFQQSFSTSDPPIAGLDDPAAPPAGAVGRETYRKGIRTFRWQARDDNQDPLDYRVSYRRAGDAEWRLLRSGLRGTVFAWDTTTIPDGAYRVKIAASDARGNAPGAALVGERDSEVFDVDNAPPRIETAARRREGGRVVLPFTVRDAQSPVRRVEIRVGAGDWRVVHPLDGVPDGLVERFEFVLDEAGGAPIVIRATDALRNSVSVFGE